jgi:hypothetical protein
LREFCGSSAAVCADPIPLIRDIAKTVVADVPLSYVNSLFDKGYLMPIPSLPCQVCGILSSSDITESRSDEFGENAFFDGCI